MFEDLTNKLEREFGYVEMQLASFPDLYAGKLCAALDRQHPRDLFDVKLEREVRIIGESVQETSL